MIQINEQVSIGSLYDLTKIEPARSLYVAVIIRAILDASKPVLTSEDSSIKTFRKEAHNWLFKDVGVTNEDFTVVCDMAGFPPDKVRILAFNVINSGDIENERAKLYKYI